MVDLREKLPGDRLLGRLPSIWSPKDDEDTGREPDVGAIGADDDTDSTWEARTEGVETDPVDEADDGGTRLRKILLGLSVFGAVLSVGAALLRRVLGDDAHEGDEAEPADTELETDDAEGGIDEGTAAMVGLAFLAAVETLRDRLLHPTE
jgi:hypothetical protein